MQSDLKRPTGCCSGVNAMRRNWRHRNQAVQTRLAVPRPWTSKILAMRCMCSGGRKNESGHGSDARRNCHDAKLPPSIFDCVCGCDSTPAVRPVKPPPLEVPAANLRVHSANGNWTDREWCRICVIASSVYHLRWQTSSRSPIASVEPMPADRRPPRSETSGLAKGSPCIHRGWRSCFFGLGESNSTRGHHLVFPSHCVHFCGFSMVDGRSLRF